MRYASGTLRTGDTQVSLDDALTQLRHHLGPKVVVVGQSVYHDIEWLCLEKGQDFARIVNIEESFKSWNAKWGNWNFFSLRHEAYALLDGLIMSQDAHDPAEDARISMRIYNKFIKNGGDTSRAKAKLQRMRYKKLFPEATNKRSHVIDGVCGSMFNSSKCICGQPTEGQ